MIWITALGVVLLFCFAVVLLVGAPYLPTLNKQVDVALTLADLKKGDTLLELGCGDGRVVVAAAKQGINVVAYELNPLLVGLAWLRTRRYRKQVTIIWGDFWKKDWPRAQAIFVFLLPKYMDKLNKNIDEYGYRPLKLVSFAFEIKTKKPSQIRDGLFVYVYK